MQPTLPRLNRRPVSAFFSLALHTSFLALLLLPLASPKIQPVLPARSIVVSQIEIAGGSHSVKILLPEMSTAARTRKPAPTEQVTTKTILPVAQSRPPKTSGGGAPPSPHAGNGSGQAMNGNGSDAEDAHPAFPVFSPRPPVADRSLLPAAERDIVIDVNVDELGGVISEKLVKGLGNKLDQIVLETVKSWRFQPATVNGKAVSTEAELIFPFNPSYPIATS